MLLGAAARAADASAWDGDSRSAIRADRRRQQRATPQACAPASRSSCSRAGRPIGAIRAIPACRRDSIFPARKMSKTVKVLWPAPHRFTDDTGTFARLQGQRDLSAAGRPPERRASRSRCGSSSITRSARNCACRPRASAELTLGAGGSAHDAALAAAEARVPKPVAAARGRPEPCGASTMRQSR